MPLSRRSFLALAPLTLAAGCRSRPRVVLYCAQDRPFAEQVLSDFTSESGLDVVPKFDTEATKSVGLYLEIVDETTKGRPRCDVFWNNEIVSTIRLHRSGLLQPYESEAAFPYPEWAKAKDHTWYAFAGRARVLIVNTKLVKPDEMPRSLFDLTRPRWKGKVAMARPQFGTTATQTACLFEVLGAERARALYRGLKDNGVHLAPGNKPVAEWVAAGRTDRGQEVAVGTTDTDDAIIEWRNKKDVALVFPDGDGKSAARMGTLFIPNTLCIPKGCPNPEGARRLVDYLLSGEVEKRLAEGASAQIPLNPKVKAQLPAPIQTPATVAAMRVDWSRAAELWDEAQAFVTKEFGSYERSG